MPGTMLELDRIDTYRGPAQILRGVSLAVDDGEAVCLVGRNGAGKTTTIDSIMGLLPVRVGKVALRAGTSRTCRARAGPPRHRLRARGRRIFPT